MKRLPFAILLVLSGCTQSWHVSHNFLIDAAMIANVGDPMIQTDYKLIRDTQKDVVSHYRTELVYSGAAGGILRIMYREYSVSYASREYLRPAYNQDLQYDLSSKMISFRDYRIELIGASNNNIRFYVRAAPSSETRQEPEKTKGPKF